MYNQLNVIEEKYKDLTEQIQDPEIINDYEKYREIAKEHSRLKDIVEEYDNLKRIDKELEDSNEMLSNEKDEDMIYMIQDEIENLKKEKADTEEKLKFMLIPKDPYDDKNIIMEIRAGTGGDEAALFTADLLKMYLKYAEIKNWKAVIINSNPTGIGGYKEVSIEIKGDNVYSFLKHEVGGHRVQRVPSTETSGRIHTSAATVAVLPEMDDIEIEIKSDELRIDTFHSSGAGGQHVNTTDSAVRITHLPTNIVVSCQNERSQIKNRERAMKILKNRLYQIKLEEMENSIASERKKQVGTGDRSDKIRTYNFPQSRVTDHRINLTLYKLDHILNGDLEEIVQALVANEQIEKLQAISDEAN